MTISILCFLSFWQKRFKCNSKELIVNQNAMNTLDLIYLTLKKKIILSVFLMSEASRHLSSLCHEEDSFGLSSTNKCYFLNYFQYTLVLGGSWNHQEQKCLWRD